MKYKIEVAVAGLIMFCILQAAVPSTAYACYCTPPDSPLVDLQRSNAVFSGTVTSITPAQIQTVGGSTYTTNRVMFQVATTWKGMSRSQIEILASGSSSSCGYEFKVGGSYLVYAYAYNDHLSVSVGNRTLALPVGARRLSTGICTRTMPLASAGQDLAVLGPGNLPEELTLFEKLLALLPQAAGVAILSFLSFLLFRSAKRRRSRHVAT